MSLSNSQRIFSGSVPLGNSFTPAVNIEGYREAAIQVSSNQNSVSYTIQTTSATENMLSPSGSADTIVDASWFDGPSLIAGSANSWYFIVEGGVPSVPIIGKYMRVRISNSGVAGANVVVSYSVRE